jgi:hypothetical protein
LQNQGYKIEYQDFSVLKQADVALNEGSIDLNVDQHTAYMQVFNKEENAKLAAITEIPTVPAGPAPRLQYSGRHRVDHPQTRRQPGARHRKRYSGQPPQSRH